jgi:hypothetical protein
VGFFIVSIFVNFKDYFFREFVDLENPFAKKDKKLMSTNTGSHHHQTLGRAMNMGHRKSGKENLIAVSQSQPKKALHPQVDLCLKLKKNIPLDINVAMDIIKKYDVCPTPEESKKTLNSEIPEVKIQMVKPNVYILLYNGE